MRVFFRQRVLLSFLWASLGLANACAPLFFWVGGQHQSNGTQSPGGSSEEVAAIAANLLVNDQTTYSGAYNTEIFTEGPADATARTLRFTVPIDSLSVYSNASLRCAPSETDLLNSNSMATLSEDIQNVIGVHQVAASDGVATASGGQATLTVSQTFASSVAITFSCRLETSTTPSLYSKAVTITLKRSQSPLIGMRDYSATDFFLPDGDTGSNDADTDYPGRQISMSNDGRYTAFTSQVKNLVSAPELVDYDTAASSYGADTHYTSDIFLFDRAKGTTELISKCKDTAIASRRSGAPQISGDGNYVVFETYATCLTGNTMGIFQWGLRQIALWSRSTKTIQILSVEYGTDQSATAAVSPANNPAWYPAINYDGSRVVFFSDAPNLNGVHEPAVYRGRIILSKLDSADGSPTRGRHLNRGDLMNYGAKSTGDTLRYEFACDASLGVEAHAPQISADGNRVFFLSKYAAQKMVPVDQSSSGTTFGTCAASWPVNVNQLYMYDIAQNDPAVLSSGNVTVIIGGNPTLVLKYGASSVEEFSVSANAETIAYISKDSPFGTAGASKNVFLASSAAAPAQLGGGIFSRKPTVSADGKTIVVESDCSHPVTVGDYCLGYYQSIDAVTWGQLNPVSNYEASSSTPFSSLTLSGDGTYLGFAAKNFADSDGWWIGNADGRSLWDVLIRTLP